MDWHEEAEKLFFKEHKTFVQIAEATGISRQTISNYLKRLPEYAAYKEEKKEIRMQERKVYQREWERENADQRNEARRKKSEDDSIVVHILRRQQQQAAAELSTHEMPSMMSQLDYFKSAYKQVKSGAYVRMKYTRGGAAVPTTLPKRVQKSL